jgi:hypothetical protein
MPLAAMDPPSGFRPGGWGVIGDAVLEIHPFVDSWLTVSMDSQ